MSQRIKLGIDLLDHLLEPGIIKGSVVLIAGNPGAGKTTLASHILYNGIVKYGETGAYVSFAESERDFYTYMEQLGLDFHSLRRRNLFKFISLLTVSDIDLVDKTVEALMEVIEEINPRRIVIDGFTALAKILSPTQLRAFLHSSLVPMLKQKADLSLIITDLPIGSNTVGYGVEEFIVDGVILMKLVKSLNGYERILEFRKIRGVPLKIQEVPYVIKAGIKPLLVYSSREDEGSALLTRRYSLLPGKLEEIPAGAQILLTGVSGSGKSVLATYMVGEKSREGVKALYISFDEPKHLIENRFKSMGYEDVLKEIVYVGIDPLTQSLSEILNYIDENVETIKPDIVVLDGVRVLHRVSNKKVFWLSTYRLTNIFRRRGITALHIYTANYPHETVPIDTLVDIILLCGLEIGEREVERAFIVWKNKYGPTPSEKMKILIKPGRGLIVRGSVDK